jgi:Domain of unknown function (DUF4912)
VVDLGYKCSDGRFYPIARSNVVNVPRAEPSSRLAERYLQLDGREIKSLVPSGPPVEATRLESVPGMRRNTEESFEGKTKLEKAGHLEWTKHGSGKTSMIPSHILQLEQAETNDPSATNCGSKEAGVIPRHVPETAVTEEQGTVRDTSSPFDLVRLTQERFSFGVSSTTEGTDSWGG